MLKALYGVAGLGPAQLAKYIYRLSGGCAVVHANKVYKVGVLPNVPCVIFHSVSQFLRNHQKVTKDHLAFVIDAPERLATIKGLLGLGYARLRNGYYAYTQLQEQDLLTILHDAQETNPVTWAHVPVNELERLQQDVGNDIVVNKVRTLAYTVQDKEARAAVTSAAYRVLRAEISVRKAERLLSRHVSATLVAKFTSMLRSKETAMVAAAYCQYRKRPERLPRICKANRVSAFTLRYLDAKSGDKKRTTH